MSGKWHSASAKRPQSPRVGEARADDSAAKPVFAALVEVALTLASEHSPAVPCEPGIRGVGCHPPETMSD